MPEAIVTFPGLKFVIVIYYKGKVVSVMLLPELNYLTLQQQ
jgi:hypothetical protein